MKKFILSLIILVIFAGTVFVIGWLEFFIPVGEYGVLISKTGGIDENVIQAGDFNWSWERLIPTNSQIHTFTVPPQTFSSTMSGTLPSAEIYENMLEGDPDFSYRFSIDITMNIKPESLPDFVQRTGGADQASLDEYLNTQAENIARSAVQFVLENSMDNVDYIIEVSLSETEIIDGIKASERYPDLHIAAIHINDVKLPDLVMYTHAKNTYTVYQEAVQATLENSAELQGFQAAEDYLELERLSRLGRILADYPLLIEFMAISGGDMDFELPKIPEISDFIE